VLASFGRPFREALRDLNETLRRALFRSGLDENAVATELGVDPKTVRRWLDGRMPYPRLRWRLATLLEADEIDLWPELLAARRAVARPTEIVAIYPHRWSVPRDTWHRLFSDATREIAILAYSGLFIADDAGLVGVLTAKANAGVKVRLALGDPDCPQVAERGEQEGIDTSLAAKIRNALVLYEPLKRTADAEIRLHRTVLYNSIYLADDEVLVNQHVLGIPAAKSPVLHLRNDGQGDLAGGYIASFERIWASALRPG
jgi:transcriptional regulator with XRE-family HTH domain